MANVPARSASPRRAVITAVGMHTCFGDTEQTWKALRAGRSGVDFHELSGAENIPRVVAARSDDPAIDVYLRDRKLKKYMSPATRMAIAAVGDALTAGRLLGDEATKRKTALFMAAGLIAFDFTTVGQAVLAARDETGHLDLHRMGREGIRKSPPLMPFQMLLNMPLGMSSIAFGIGGPNSILYPGAEAAVTCLHTAVRGIESGRFDQVLVGATAQGLSLLPSGTADRFGLLSRSPIEAQPFTVGHQGLAMADGAACLLIEATDAAKGRGVPPLAEVRLPERMRWLELDQAPDGRRLPLDPLWARAAHDAPPEIVVTSGRYSSREETELLATVDRLWADETVHVASYEGALGHAGPFGAITAVALSALMIGRRHALPMTHLDVRSLSARVLVEPSLEISKRILVSIADPSGAEAAVMVSKQTDEA